MRSRLFSLVALLFISSTLYAQSDAQVRYKEAPARYQIYGGYSFLSNSLNGVPGYEQGINGFDVGFAIPPWHNLRFKVDFSAYRGSNLGSPQHPYFILGGGQYDIHLGRETLFAEGLAGTGGANKTWAANNDQGQTASFAANAGGGLDSRITRHVAFRVGGDFQYSYFLLNGPSNHPYRIAGLPTNFGRINSAIVWQF
jgi:hypothetical protein